jgi:protoporphyrinogen IX oxidase
VADFLTAFYPWTKSLHVIAMVAWMAGLFYLPRMFVYHVERAVPGSEASEIFKVMERKLLRLIMTPSLIATWLFGLLLLVTPGVVLWGSDGWIYLKIALVLGLTWFHHWCGMRRRDLEADRNTRSGRHYRAMNEVPTLALVAIVILVVVKPI